MDHDACSFARSRFIISTYLCGYNAWLPKLEDANCSWYTQILCLVCTGPPYMERAWRLRILCTWQPQTMLSREAGLLAQSAGGSSLTKQADDCKRIRERWSS